METLYNDNIRKGDRVARAVLGLMLVLVSTVVLVLSPGMIASVCLVAAYLLMTALIGWDPLIATATRITHRLHLSSARPLHSSRVARA